jgi:hypothetical protein
MMIVICSPLIDRSVVGSNEGCHLVERPTNIRPSSPSLGQLPTDRYMQVQRSLSTHNRERSELIIRCMWIGSTKTAKVTILDAGATKKEEKLFTDNPVIS